MTTGNTSLLGLALPVEGELDGTWGDIVNDSITSLVDSAVAGTTTLSADADVTLTTTVLAANQARQAVILWTASNGATTRNITAPARSKAYIVINAGTGSVVLRGAGPTTGVTVVAGEKCLAAWNGSDFVKVASTIVNLATQVTGTLPVANGGTGASTFTANNVLLGNGTSALQVVAPGTTGNVLTSNGTTWQSTAPAAQSYPAAGVAVSTGSAWTTSLTAPTGALVGTTDTQTLTNKTIEAGTFTNGYTEETVTANTGTAYTIDLANGTVQVLTLTGNCTFTFPAAASGKSFILLLKQDGTGSRTVTWPAAVKWPGATAPTITSTASKLDKYIFTSDGTNWYGSNAGQNYTV